MKIRVADYIVNKVIEAGVKTTFSVVGGGAMNLNDAFGHAEGMNVIYNHHEQACAIAAEGYARVNNEMAAVVLTTGPGGTNALTGVVGAYVDSVPMLVISGQVRWDSFSLSTGLNLRAMGDQEFNIVSAVKTMTKYAEIVTDKNDIRYIIEKAIYLATHGRMGPTWVDIPGDIQSAYVDTDELKGYDYSDEVISKPSDDEIYHIINKIKESKRPVIYAGSAIRLSGAFSKFKMLIEKLNVPVVCAWNSSDAMESDHRLYAGRPGNFGDRAGNFAVQNSDLIISLGCRLSIRQTGFNYKSWAPKSYVIMVDIDENELKKPTLHVEYPICANVKDVIDDLYNKVKDSDVIFDNNSCWIEQCKDWMEKYPVIKPVHFEQKELANAYAVIDLLSKNMPEDMITISGNGTACVVGGHGYTIKKGTRFIENSGMASMGYDLPAAIGACFANGRKPLICLTGDGSIQMNIQELQTIIHHQLPIKIIIINNDGYHSIRQSQSNFFKGKPLCGVGKDSLDLSFPDMEKLAYAYGFKFFRCKTNDEFAKYMDADFKYDGPQICEVMVDKVQYFAPKAGSKKLEDGSMVSAPLEDLAPYLDREELKEIMSISED
ncbi:MAG: thiamine pyrophosphate-binding protein [Erysipelotrichaceae bacterium]|nr:thiamine pyrophosphate-binding protein [Erysipelotrichaceae bacterium]